MAKSWLNDGYIFNFPLDLIVSLLGRLQGASIYRIIAKILLPKIYFMEADLDDMKKIYVWFTNDSAQTPAFHDPNVTNIVAKKGNRIIAYIQLVRRPLSTQYYSEYWLFSLKVKPIYRGMGIGSTLSRRVIQTAISEGAKEILLQVNTTNVKAIKLYEKLGFIFKKAPAIDAPPEKKISLHEQKMIIMSKYFQ